MAGENRKTKEELVEELAESRANYSLAMDAMLDGIHVVDRDLRFLLVNKPLIEWTRGFGISGDLIGKTLREVFAFLPDRVWEEYRQVFNTGKLLATVEMTMVDGREVFTETTKVPITEDRKVTRVMTILHDVTEQRRIEHALRESEEKFRTLAEESPNMIFIMVGERVVYTNQRSLEVLGYSREEFYSPKMNTMMLIAPEYLEKTSRAFARYLEGQEVEAFEYALITRSGKRIPAIIATRLIDYEGKRALMGVITDISARKAAEEALRTSEEKYRTFVENFQGIAYRGALDGTPMFFEGDVMRITGYSEGEFLAGQPKWEDIIHRDDRARATKRFVLDSATGGESGLEKEYRIVRKDGTVLWVHQSVRPVRDEAGTPIFIQGAVYDITARKRAEEGRERERKAFRVIADSAVLDEDASGVCGRVLPELARLIGFSYGTIRLYDPERQVLRLAASVGMDEDFVKSSIVDQPIESPCHVAAHVARTMLPIFAPDVTVGTTLMAFKERIEEMNVRSLVSWPLATANHDLLGVLHLWHDEPREIPEDDRGFFETVAGMLCVVLDRKRTQQALERSEARYRRRFEASSVPQWEEDLSGARECFDNLQASGISDFGLFFSENPEKLKECIMKSRILEVNRAALELFGATDLEEFERLRIRNLTSVSRDAYIGWISAVLAGDMDREIEVEFNTMTGETRPVLMRVSTVPGYEQSLARIMVSMQLRDRPGK
jgi:PAS domain S-box-containing protein